MAFKLSGRVFFQLPIRNTADSANPLEPLVSEPPGSPAVSGVVDDEGFIAVGGNLGLVSEYFDGFDAM